MINKALKLLRTFHGLTQTDLAMKLGVAKSWISEIEKGNKAPTFALLQGYAAVFDMPLSSIMFFSENLESNKPSERARVFVSKKIIAILEYISDRSDDDAIDREKEKVSDTSKPLI